MAKYCKECAGDLDEVTFHLEEVYGNAYWALRCGSTKESVLAQVVEAFTMFQDEIDREAIKNKEVSDGAN